MTGNNGPLLSVHLQNFGGDGRLIREFGRNAEIGDAHNLRLKSYILRENYKKKFRRKSTEA